MMMTQKQFDTEIRRLTRRAQLLREARGGSVKLREVKVDACTVTEHQRVAHSRFIAPKGWKSKAS